MSDEVPIYYVLYPSDREWCSNFVYEALRRHTGLNIQAVELKDVMKCRGGIVHFENIQLIKHLSRFRSKALVKKLREQNLAVVAGVRGDFGLDHKDRFKELDALAVNVDPGLKEETQRLHGQVFEIPEGVDTFAFMPNHREPDEFTVGWVGRDHKGFKNADLLPRLGFEYRKATYNEYIPHEEMPEFYGSITVLLNMSDHEGFCMPILEAAAHGLPVVSSDVGVAREILDEDWIVKGSPRAHLDEYRDLLQLLNEDPYLRREVGRENRERALGYDWEIVAKEYEKMWGKLRSMKRLELKPVL
ncbi:glycosyltransferase family 4 protein [Candidatus Bathyarchaeota archaeon]|nr:glycosyltransferase family 4 protein [Candidatus Bathyarchaeota archaeon]